MVAYALVYKKDFENVSLTKCDSKAQAEQIATAHDGGDFGLAVGEAADLGRFSMLELVGLYSGLTGNSVNRFRDLAAGQKRIFTSIIGLADQAAQPKASDNDNDPVDGVVKTKGKTKAAKKQTAAKVSTKGEPKKSGIDRKPYDRMNIDGKLDIIVKENPRVEGSKSWVSYKLMKQGMKVRDFLAKGGRQADLRHDIKKGRVKMVVD
jgi:hypothetical protein